MREPTSHYCMLVRASPYLILGRSVLLITHEESMQLVLSLVEHNGTPHGLTKITVLTKVQHV
jgi:hypothetical protein